MIHISYDELFRLVVTNETIEKIFIDGGMSDNEITYLKNKHNITGKMTIASIIQKLANQCHIDERNLYKIVQEDGKILAVGQARNPEEALLSFKTDVPVKAIKISRRKYNEYLRSTSPIKWFGHE